MPLSSKPLAFLIENPWDQNPFQLADNKENRPVLIENFEPNGARVFAPPHAQQIAPADTAQPQFAPFLTGSAPQTEFDVTYSKQTLGKFLTGARTAIKIFKLCARRTQKLTRRGGYKRYMIHRLCVRSETHDRAFLPGSGSQVEIDVTHPRQTAGSFLPGATTARCLPRELHTFSSARRYRWLAPLRGTRSTSNGPQAISVKTLTLASACLKMAAN